MIELPRLCPTWDSVRCNTMNKNKKTQKGVTIVCIAGTDHVECTTAMDQLYKMIIRSSTVFPVKVTAGYNPANVIAGYHGLNSASSDAKAYGYPTNEKITFETQYYIATRHIVADLETRRLAAQNNVGLIILNRTVLDVIPYTMASENITKNQKILIQTMVYQHYKLYPIDHLFYLESPIIRADYQVQGSREDFKDAIDHYYKMVLNVALGDKHISIPEGPMIDKIKEIIPNIPRY